MDQSNLSGLPQSAQLFIYGLAGLGVIGWMIVRYFKEADAAKKGHTGLMLAGDQDACRELTAVLERCAATGDRLDFTIRRNEEATRDLREEIGKIRGTLAISMAMPREEQIDLKLGLILRRLEERGEG